MINKKTIAIFDFDGTITKMDSLPHFLWHNSSWNKKIGAVILLPSFGAWFLRIIDNTRMKEIITSHFFKGISAESFDILCGNYCAYKLPLIIREGALEKIKWHKEMGHKLVIVSASIKNWIKPWAKENYFNDIIATELEVVGGVITGKFSTPNCSGKEKVRRFLEYYPDKDNYFIYAYGDSKKDKDLLLFADKSFYKKF